MSVAAFAKQQVEVAAMELERIAPVEFDPTMAKAFSLTVLRGR